MAETVSRHSLDHEVPALDQPQRLDKYLADTLALFPRSQYERRNVRAVFGTKELKPSFRLEGGETLAIGWDDLPEVSFGAEDLPLEVLYEDDLVIVLNKARGMVVHPAHGNWSGTVVQGLLHHVKELQENFEEEEGSEIRPGIVHRLDKDTTGVLITAKTPEALEFLSAQFRDRSTEKTYWAVLKGTLKGDSGLIEGFLGRDPKNRQRFAAVGASQGKPAATSWSVVGRVPGYTLVRFRPHTGRTHQLRVHSLGLGAPILGDPIYARTDPRFPQAPLMLHAGRLAIELPGGRGRQVFRAPWPEDFQGVLGDLGLPVPPNDGPG